MGLAKFLEARIAEDKLAALTARIGSGDREWKAEPPGMSEGRIYDSGGEVVVYDEGSPTFAQAQHIARHDPGGGGVLRWGGGGGAGEVGGGAGAGAAGGPPLSGEEQPGAGRELHARGGGVGVVRALGRGHQPVAAVTAAVRAVRAAANAERPR